MLTIKQMAFELVRYNQRNKNAILPSSSSLLSFVVVVVVIVVVAFAVVLACFSLKQPLKENMLAIKSEALC